MWGNGLVSDQVSASLGLLPSLTLEESHPGSLRHSHRSCWAYDGREHSGFQFEWSSLEDGLSFLTGVLRPLQSKVADLSGQFRVMWWCGHFQSSFDGGPTLSAELLTELGAWRLPLFIDNYFGDE